MICTRVQNLLIADIIPRGFVSQATVTIMTPRRSLRFITAVVNFFEMSRQIETV